MPSPTWNGELEQRGFEDISRLSWVNVLTRVRRQATPLQVSLLRNSFVKQLLAALMMVVWVGAFHHEEWTELADVHHHHHGDTNHGHHDHEPVSEDDEQAPIPLPDTHSTAVALSSTKALSDHLSSEAGGFLISSFLFLLADEWSVALSHDSPRFLQAVSHDPALPRLSILAPSIRANAPPVLS